MDAAWLADPSGIHELRYFDGSDWTRFCSDAGVQVEDEMDASSNQVAKSKAGFAERVKSAAEKGLDQAKALKERHDERTAAKPEPITVNQRVSTEVVQSTAGGAAAQPLLKVTSNEEGRNSQVTVWPDRIERVKEKKLTSLSRARQDAEVIPVKSISSVQAKKDGLRTRVIVFASGNTIEFRMPHGEAERMRAVLTNLILTKAAPSVATATPTSGSVADELKKLAELRDAGVLSDEEFLAQKTRLLG